MTDYAERVKQMRVEALDAAEAADDEAAALTIFAERLRKWAMGERFGAPPTLGRARATVKMKRTMEDKENAGAGVFVRRGGRLDPAKE